MATKIDDYKWKDKTHALNKLLEGIKGFIGQMPRENCTNKIWIVIFAFFNIVLFLIWNNSNDVFQLGVENNKNDDNWLWDQHDWRADVCGTHHLKSKPKVFYLNPENWDVQIGHCVAECPVKD